MKQFSLLFFFALININLSFSQPWLNTGDVVDFETERRLFYNYWQDKSPDKGQGYNQFKRFEHFFESRLTEDGKLPAADINFKTWETHFKNYKYSGSRNNTSNWTPSGPSTPSNATPYQNIGRVNCMAFHPTNPNILWIGTPAGGIWKTTNHGDTWIPMTDNMPNLGVSSLVVDPTNPNIMYWATGDADGRNTWTIGVLKSTDGGTTWNTTGFNSLLSTQHRIFKVIMHPKDRNILFIATSNGIWKTTNAGANWTQTVSSQWSDIEFHPANPNVMYAAGWFSGGVSRVYVSTNGGTSWTSKPNISTNVGRISIDVHPSNPDRILAICTRADNGGLEGIYESVDLAESFKKIYSVDQPEQNLHGTYFTGSNVSTRGQGSYNNAFIINKNNPDEMFVGGVNTWKSSDGGKTWKINTYWVGNSAGVQVVHADKHNFYYHPLLPNRLYDCNDGGLNYTDNNGNSWEDISTGLSISQIYKIGITEQNNKTVMVGLQDNGSKDLSDNRWTDVWGGDGMQCHIDPSNENIKYAMSQNANSLVRTSNNWATRSSILGSHPEKEKGAWITPYILAPGNSKRIYIGMKGFYKSDNNGTTWQKLCDSLPNGLQFRHIVMPEKDTSTFYASTSFVIFKSSDGGQTWNQLINTSPRVITSLKIHENDASRLYMTQGNYTSGQHVFQSNDGGISWSNITFNLPNIPTNAIEIHKGNNALFVGTDLGVFIKEDKSNEWNLYSNNLPNTIVNDLQINYKGNTLWAATYGRGLWSTQLQFSSGNDDQQIVVGHPKVFPNPGKGDLQMEYSLKQKAEVTISIIDIQGKTLSLNTLGPQNSGAHIYKLPTEGLQDGIYFVKLAAGDHQSVVKVIVSGL
jgi:photosystem II stability/assembly factor-like uncharacterized protein